MEKPSTLLGKLRTPFSKHRELVRKQGPTGPKKGDPAHQGGCGISGADFLSVRQRLRPEANSSSGAQSTPTNLSDVTKPVEQGLLVLQHHPLYCRGKRCGAETPGCPGAHQSGISCRPPTYLAYCP